MFTHIRLMESRKSARLLNTDTDFSRLADFNIVEQVSATYLVCILDFYLSTYKYKIHSRAIC